MNYRDEFILKKSQDPFFCNDLIGFICGDHIASGTFRDVFEYNLDPKLVVKIQRDKDSFNNIIEFEIWNEVRFTPFEKFFAGCRWISIGGRVMLQEKTKPITKTRRPPELIPTCFADIKEDNFGFIGNRFVAHDYDFSLGLLDLSKQPRMKKWKSHIKEENK